MGIKADWVPDPFPSFGGGGLHPLARSPLVRRSGQACKRPTATKASVTEIETTEKTAMTSATEKTSICLHPLTMCVWIQA